MGFAAYQQSRQRMNQKRSASEVPVFPSQPVQLGSALCRRWFRFQRRQAIPDRGARGGYWCGRHRQQVKGEEETRHN